MFEGVTSNERVYIEFYGFVCAWWRTRFGITRAWVGGGSSGAEQWLSSEADKLVSHYQAISVHWWQSDNIYSMSRSFTREISYIVCSITTLRSLFDKAEANWDVCSIFVNSVDYNYVALNLKVIGFKIEVILSPQRLIYKQKIYIDRFTSATFQLGDGMVLCNSWGFQTVLRSHPLSLGVLKIMD